MKAKPAAERQSRVRHEESILTQSRHATASVEETAQSVVAKSKKDSRSAWVLFALAMVVGISSLFLVKAKPGDGIQRIDLTNIEQRRKLEASVNRHIQMTNRKIETDKERIKVEAAFTIPRVGALVGGDRKEVQSGGLDLRADRREYNAVRDADRRGESSQAMNVADVVHNEMAQAELQRHAEEARKKEYAKQYVENARRNGFDVQLDAEYRIISVKEIKRDARESIGEAYR